MKRFLPITAIRNDAGERHPAVIVEADKDEPGSRLIVARMTEHGTDKLAMLFAAAPELLAAVEAEEAADAHWSRCQACCDDDGCEEHDRLVIAAHAARREALTKARGGA